MTLWLVGMMGSGKSSAGRLAASTLGVPFADTDDMVEASTGESIADIWANSGEEVFRSLETEAVAAASEVLGIVSTGGGVVLDAVNRNRMRMGRAVVWLDAEVSVLETRLAEATNRPGLTAAGEESGHFLGVVLEERKDLYMALATHRIDTSRLEPEEVAARIIEIWND